MYSNDDTEICAICLETYNNVESTLNLSCQHKFHSSCIMKYIDITYEKCYTRKEYKLCCNSFKCPLCRAFINCKDSNPVIYYYYKSYKKDYKELSNDIKRLQNQIYKLAMKIQFKKIFTRLSKTDVYNYLLEEETLLEYIMEKKSKVENVKKMMNRYKQIYYSTHSYCFI